jgi:uncharacterized repeat protein (TIGR01451 family)
MIQVVLEPTKLTAGQPNQLTVCLTNTSRETVTNLVCRLDLPANITLLKGSARIEIFQMPPGQRFHQTLQVLPISTGTWVLTSSNFSYRDSSSKPHRIKDLCCEITVVGALPPPPEANIEVKLHAVELYLNQWEKLQGEILNIGSVDIRKLAVKVVGRVKCNADVHLGVLPKGKQVEFSISVSAFESGNHVPASVEVTYTDVIGRTGFRKISTPLRVIKAMSDTPRTVHVKGNYVETVKGSYNEHRYAQNQSPAEAAAEIQQLLVQLQQSYPTNLEGAIQQEIKRDPTFRNRLRNALKEGGLETLKVFFAPLGIAIETVRGWINAE